MLSGFFWEDSLEIPAMIRWLQETRLPPTWDIFNTLTPQAVKRERQKTAQQVSREDEINQ